MLKTLWQEFVNTSSKASPKSFRLAAGSSRGRQPAPPRIWNKLPDAIAAAVIELAIKQPEWSPRELATAFVGQQQYCLRGVGLPTSWTAKTDPTTNCRYGILPPIKLQRGGAVIRCWT